MTRIIQVVKCPSCKSEDWNYAGKFFIVGNQTLAKCEGCFSMFTIVYGRHYSLHGLKKEVGIRLAKQYKQNSQSRNLMSEMQKQIKKFEDENQ